MRSISTQTLAAALLAATGVISCSGGPTIVFTTQPPTTAEHNREYRYPFAARGIDLPLSFTAQGPPWLQLDPPNLLLHGTPGWDNLDRAFQVVLRASDGTHEAAQVFTIRVTLGEIICDQEFGDPAQSEYILPFRAGESYRINQGYCPSNPTWGHHNWFAYDFETPIGTNLIAMRAGRVFAVQSDREDNVLDCGPNSGNYIFMRHDDGTVAVYGHLTRNGVLVNRNDSVQQGDHIGISGNSGCSSGPHVHVGIYRADAPFERQYSLPFNFRNAEGELDANHGLIYDRVYKAL